MYRQVSWAAWLVVFTVAMFPWSHVGAGSITFLNQSVDLSGTGFGNTLRVLALQANGSESGSVAWNGASDALTADATNQSQTLTAQTLSSSGVTPSRFKLVFNIAEPGSGPTVKLFDFAMQFVDMAGVPLFGDLVYSAPVGGLELNQVAAGIGGAGWLFDVDLTPAEAAAFFGTGTNRIGMSVAAAQAIQLTGGAAEVFFVAPVPEPASWALAAMGAAILTAMGQVRRVGRREPKA